MTDLSATFVGMSVLLGCIAGVVVFALLKFGEGIRSVRRVRRDRGGSALMTTAIEEAVTKLKRQERATQARADASERLSTEIISNLTAGLLVVDNVGEVRILNPAAHRLLGLEDGRVVGQYRDVLGVGSPLAEAIDECLLTGEPITRRRIPFTPGLGGASTSHLGVSVSPMRSATDLQGAICLFTDLTAVTALEEQLRLRESLAALGELTAGLAHEFRNGLATIHGYGRLLDPGKVPEVFRPYVEGIRQETETLGQVVTSFVNFARPVDLTLSSVELRSICERAADEVRADARARRGEIELLGEFPAVDGDEVLLRQAFSNLCRNAVEACAGHGVAPMVTIEGRIDHGKRLARVNVIDNGPGVDAASVDRIFRPFFTTKSTGTGLGLALVQKIVVTHNGRISVQPAPAGGARFEVVLPMASS